VARKRKCTPSWISVRHCARGSASESRGGLAQTPKTNRAGVPRTRLGLIMHDYGRVCFMATRSSSKESSECWPVGALGEYQAEYPYPYLMTEGRSLLSEGWRVSFVSELGEEVQSGIAHHHHLLQCLSCWQRMRRGRR